MQDDINLPRASLETALSSAIIDAVVQATAGVLARSVPPTAGSEGNSTASLPPLLSPGQAAKLMGVSRQTVDRMVADGELPSITMREGARQRMIRIPSGFIVQMLKDARSGVSITLKEYAARWSESFQIEQPGTISTAPLPDFKAVI